MTQSEIDRGTKPALTVRQLVSAVRQDLAILGAEFLIADLDEIRLDKIREAVYRINQKCTLAINEAGREKP